jgi:hypothetical protein
MIRKFVLFNIVILIICSFVLLDNLESRAESIMNKNTLDIQKQSYLRVNEGENDTNLRGIINNNDTSPIFESSYDIVVIDGFNKGRFVGYWVGRKTRIYACNKLNLDCYNRSEIENE